VRKQNTRRFEYFYPLHSREQRVRAKDKQGSVNPHSVVT